MKGLAMKQIVEKSRYLAVLGVIGLLVTGVVAFTWGLYKTGLAILSVLATDAKSSVIILETIKIMDIFLVATTLLIFAASLYELFIAEVNVPDWMIAHNLHELKSKLSSMIILVIAGKFAEDLFGGVKSEDLMREGIAIAVISATLIAFSYFGKKD
jgi:uncharacterized membrane protein YqhA